MLGRGDGVALDEGTETGHPPGQTHLHLCIIHVDYEKAVA